MKKIGILTILTALILQGFSQITTAEKRNTGPETTVTDTSEVLKVVVGQELLIVEDGEDAVKVKVGSRGLTILENPEGDEPKFQFKKFDDDDEANRKDDFEDREKERADRRSRFRGHWAGVEFGFNNYSTSDYSLNLPENIAYMSLHSGKSHNFNKVLLRFIDKL